MVGLLVFFTKPDTQRKWWPGNRSPPMVKIDREAGKVAIRNVRHFKWRTREDFEPSWVYQTYYLDQLDSLDLIIEPLGDSRWFAHTMLSFGFGPERRVVISIEARREQGEKFGILPGMYKQFELFYQINSERDALTLRAINPDSNLYIYPVKATPEFMRKLFLDMVTGAHSLLDAPVFYHSLSANCTTELFEHVNRELPEPLGYRREVLFPAQAGKLLHELGWMDTELSYEEARARFRLADKVREFAEHPEFSKKIRE